MVRGISFGNGVLKAEFLEKLLSRDILKDLLSLGICLEISQHGIGEILRTLGEDSESL